MKTCQAQKRIKESARQSVALKDLDKATLCLTVFFSLFFFFVFTTNTFAAVTRYWVGPTDGASTASTANWASSSGGAGGQSVPVAGDTAIFDGAGTGNHDALIDSAFSVLTASTTVGYTKVITQNANVTIGGDFKLTSASQWAVTSGTITFNGGNIAQTITTNGTLSGTVVINKTVVSGGDFTIAAGTSINLGDNPTTNLTCSGTRTINLINNGTITINSGIWTLVNSYVNNTVILVNNGTITHNGNGWIIGTANNFSFTNNVGATTTYEGSTLSIYGDFTQEGSFDLSGKAVIFTGGYYLTVKANGLLGGTAVINKSGGNLTIATGTSINLGDNPTSTITSGGGAAVYNLINNGTIIVNSGTWTLVNNYINNPAVLINNGIITHNGNGWVIGTAYSFSLTNNATINYASTTLSIVGSFTQNGTFDLTGKTVTFNGAFLSIVTSNGALGGTVVISKTNGDFTVATGTIINLGDNPTTTIYGVWNFSTKFTNNGTILINSGVWTITNQSSYLIPFINNGTITHNGNGWVIGTTNQVSFANNTGATTTYAGTSFSTNNNFTNSGTFTASSLTSLSIPGNLTNTGTIITGAVAVTIGGNLTQTGAGTSTFATTTFNGATNSIVTTGVFGGVVIINKSLHHGSFTVATGTTINLGNNATTTLATTHDGYFINNGTVIVGSGTWTINNVFQSTDTFTNNGSITFSGSNLDINGIKFVNNGTFTYSGSVISVENDFFQNGTFALAGKTITFDGTYSATVTANGALGGTVIISKTLHATTFTVATGTTINLGNNATTTLSTAHDGNLINSGTIIVGTGSWVINNLMGASYLDTFTNNGTIISSGSSWDINGIKFVNNGTVTYSGDTINFEIDFIQNGTFDLTGKRLTFDNTYTATVSYNGILGGTVIINKNLHISTFTIATGTTINLGNNATTTFATTHDGTLINNGTILVGTDTWTINAVYAVSNSFVNNGSITILGSGLDINDIKFINNGTITYLGNTINIANDFTQNGIFDFTGKIVTFDGIYNATATIPVFGGSLILAKSAANTLTLGNSMTVVNATTTTGILANPASPLDLTVTGNLSIADASKFGGANLTVKMSNGNDQNLTVTTGSILTPLTINKTTNTKVSLQTNYTGSGAAATVTVNSGALYLNGKTLSATTTVNNGGEFQIQGGEIFTTPTLNTGSTFTYVGNGNGSPNTYYINQSLPYYNLKINGTDANDSFSMDSSTNNGLVGYWKLDEASGPALDSSSNNNSGAWTNSPIATTSVPFLGFSNPRALNFTGGSQYVTAPNSSVYNLGSNFSVSAWVYLNAYPSATKYAGIVNRGGYTSNNGFEFLMSGLTANANKMTLVINQRTLSGVTAFPLNAWKHVTFTYDGSNMYMYINGTLNNSISYSTAMTANAQALEIGRRDPTQGLAETLNGSIDDVRIYSRALTSTEITTLAVGTATSTLTLPGSLTVSRGIISATSTNLIMSGASSTISLNATTTFASLTAGSTTASTTLNFGTTGSLVITGTTTLQGTSTMPLTLRSTTPNAYWYFNPQGPRVFNYIDVKDSYNQNAVNIATPANVIDSGHNYGWTLTQPILTIGRSGQQLATTTATSTNVNLGGAFTLTPSGGNFTLNTLKLYQAGSFPIEHINTIKVYYEASSTCAAIKPSSATSFATSTTFNTSKIATTTFYTPLTLSQGSTTCLYLTYSLSGESGTSTMGRTIDLEISSPPNDVGATGGSITPTNNINIKGVTMIPPDNAVIVATSPTPPNPNNFTNSKCVSKEITSLLSLSMPREAKNPTLYYLQNCMVYKQVGTSTPVRISPANAQVQDLTFQKYPGGFVHMSVTISNMDPGQEGNFYNVTRTISTGSTIKAWRGE